MKEINLTRGKVAIVDDHEYPWLKDFTWCAAVKGGKFYAQTGKSDTMHRMIVNAKKGETVDHINGNTLDNRRENLRVCTHAQNRQNSKKISGSRNLSSKYKGVSHPSENRWTASITVMWKTIHIGSFSTEIGAARAYDEAARKYHGVFAKLNFPQESA
jgi:hypothetical protein